MPGKTLFSYPINDVMIAACTAFRINGEYNRHGGYNTETEKKILPNREIMYQILRQGEIQTLDSDVELADKVLGYAKSLIMEVIKGTNSDWVKMVAELSQKEFITSPLEVGVIASLPLSYFRNLERQKQNMKLFGKDNILDEAVGNKIELEVDTVRCNYSEHWNVYYVTAVTGNSTVFYSSKNKISPGQRIRISGTVKDHKDNNRTQLTRVKILETL